MKTLLRFWNINIVVLLLPALIVNPTASLLQQTNEWSQPEKIPEYKISTEEPPFLVADQNRVVHAFNSQPLELNKEGSPQAVFYRQWMLDGGWSHPVDIVLNPIGGDLELLGVYLDKADIVHLAIQMNIEEIYYTQAPLINAGKVTAWSPLKLIATQSTTVRPGISSTAVIAGDGNGTLVIIYSGKGERNGLNFAYSQDNGVNWFEQPPIYLTFNPALIVVYPRIYSGQSGLLHAVWSTFNEDGSGGPGYYAQLDLQSLQWSRPVQLDVPGIRTPSVIEFGGEVFVSYYHHNVNGNWWRRSFDQGKTWTEPVQFSEIHQGTNGAVSFVTDSNNVMRAFFGERIDDNNHGMWHLIWDGDRWSVPEAVVRGPQIKDEIGGKGFDPKSANAIISNGNVLLVTWGTDGAAGENGAWYSYRVLDTPGMPLVPLSTQNAIPVTTTYPDFVAENTNPNSTPTQPYFAEFQNENPTSAIPNPSTSLIVGPLSAIFIIMLFVIVRVLLRRVRN